MPQHSTLAGYFAFPVNLTRYGSEPRARPGNLRSRIHDLRGDLRYRFFAGMHEIPRQMGLAFQVSKMSFVESELEGIGE